MVGREPYDQRGGVLEFMMAELRSGIADIRSKLIDEGWFGRHTPDRPVMRDIPEQDFLPDHGGEEEPSFLSRLPSEFFSDPEPFEKQWAIREPGAEPNKDGPSPEIGIDR